MSITIPDDLSYPNYMNQKSVDIVIVNWNTGKLLARCLEALQSLPEQELIHGVYIVDNASRDDSLKLAQQVTVTFPVDITSSPVNQGFAKANNVALAKIRQGESTAHILLLNPDTRMKAGSLRVLVDLLEQQPQAGVVGLKLLNPDGSLQPSVRAFPTFVIFLTFFLKLNHVLAKQPFWQHYLQTDFNYNQAQRVDQVMGAVFLIRHAAWKEIGDLDDHYWIWFEEVDYCQKVKRSRWEVWYTPAGEVVHFGAVSFHQLVGIKRTWPFIQSSLVYTGIYLSPWQFMILWLLTPLALLVSLPASFFHLQQKQSTTAIRYEN